MMPIRKQKIERTSAGLACMEIDINILSMSRIVGLSLIVFIFINQFSSSLSLQAKEVKKPDAYAADRLANAQAQLDALYEQKNALNSLIKAVKKELKAAKIRAKAEAIQHEADTELQDAEFLIEESGVSVALPDVAAPQSNAPLLEDVSASVDSGRELFPKESFDEVDSVFFPGAETKKKKNLPYYIK